MADGTNDESGLSVRLLTFSNPKLTCNITILLYLERDKVCS